MVLRPELHVWVSGEERLPGQLSLLRVRLYLDHSPGEDEVSAPRVLLVVVVLLAVVALGWQGEEYSDTETEASLTWAMVMVREAFSL